MKNKFILFLAFLSVIFFLLLSLSQSEAKISSENIKFESEQILTLENGDIVIGIGNAEVKIANQIKISGNKYTFFRNKNLLIIEKNVTAVDLIKNNILKSQLIHYDANKLEIISYGKTFININEKYKITSNDIHYLTEEEIIHSKKSATFIDNLKNKTELGMFNYSIKNEILKGSNIKHWDNKDNYYSVTDGMINFKEKKILGKDIMVLLKNDVFGNPDNEPKLKGNSISYGNDLTIVDKGIFTSCKTNEDCTPWSIKSKKIIHDKKNKEIKYEKAWLNIYDKPIFYFPKFFHPDPSVKRKSGFLTPQLKNSNKLGTSATIPYFYVIAENEDMTFKPKIFNEKQFLLHSEYRQVTKNLSNILDFSLNYDNKNKLDGTKTHFFSNSKFNLELKDFDEAEITLNLEKVSNDNYIKLYSLEDTNSIVNDTSILESLVKFSGSKEQLNMDLTFEVYETLNKPNSDRYEFIYPNYNISKNIFINKNLISDLSLSSTGNQKKYSTNIYEGVQINDFLLTSNEFLGRFGFNDELEILFKNVNSVGKNSSKFKDNEQAEILGIAKYSLSMPLIKKTDDNLNLLTPKLSFMHSPNDGKNLKNEERKLGIDNAFSLNRIGFNDSVEGGTSLTIGLDFDKKNSNDNSIFLANIATVFRNDENENLPISSKLGKKQSDIVGSINFIPSEIIDFKYNYSLNNNFDEINLHNFETNVQINNFVNNFNFYEENNLIGNESYYQNKLSYFFNPNSSFSFQTRENKKTNLTEFYDLIYEYKNDCLIASVRYNKEYYTNNNLKPNEQLFFNITLIPLGSTNTENILDQ